MLPPPRSLVVAASWLAAWLLERVLGEVEAKATAGVRDTEYTARCWWCGKVHAELRIPGTGDPDWPPPDWLSSGAYPDSDRAWCSLRCWAEHSKFDPSVGSPGGPDWDAMLDADQASTEL